MFIDLKYLGFIQMRLKNFVKKDSRLFNCSCPLCGDGSDSRKARGYFMPKKKGQGLYYFCHRCNAAQSFSRFLESFDSTLYQEYRTERLRGKYSPSAHIKDSLIEVPKFDTKRILKTSAEKRSITDYLQNMADMPANISTYLIQRKISPDILWKYFFYTNDFKKIANIVCPNTYNKKACFYKESRIVLLLINEDKKIAAVQGREIEKSYAKYITIKVNEDSKKIFGLDRINKKKPVIVVEGPIDSCFLDNSIGVCGADLVSQVSDLKIKPVFCFDNEPRSKIITGKILRAINDGHEVIIFPENIYAKDINDMVIGGVDVNRLMKQRVFSGLKAKIEYNKWKRT